MKTFTNQDVDIWIKSESSKMYGITVYNTRLAWQLNAILEHYPKLTKFEINEEPIFYFNESQIEYIATRNAAIGRILVLLLDR